MKEIKGSYLIWGTILIFLLHLFIDFLEVTHYEFIKLILDFIKTVITVLIVVILMFTQIVIPFMYCLDSEDVKGSIKLSLIYWIIQGIKKLNYFCNKYFTIKL